MENLFTHQNIEKVLKPTQELLDNTSNQANYIHNILAQLSGVESNTDKDMLIKMLYDAIHIFTERYTACQ
ncbi:hypothetical protein [uncultured Chryseobacterium sp.]|uniref:hypothetical protein n=1 Tax=uncultured Chryseobacterium sp. TaxID=259322 RepID=UPI0025CFDFC6|nr:hypothetical protein [uncultured Chryseobacterium sp.]